MILAAILMASFAAVAIAVVNATMGTRHDPIIVAIWTAAALIAGWTMRGEQP